MLPSKIISDEQLIARIRGLSRRERALQIRLLDYLGEIDRRRLYRGLGYSSLFDFMTKELKYSAGAAQRRIDAARLVASVPKARGMATSGAISLSALARTQSIFRADEKINDRKLAADFKAKLIEKIADKPIDEVTRVLHSHLPKGTDAVQARSSDSLRAIGHDLSRLSVILDEGLRKKLERARELSARKLSGKGWSEIIELLANDYLQRNDPVVRASRAHQKSSSSAPPSATQARTRHSGDRYIPAKLRHFVWRRDRGQCQFKNPATGQICGSRAWVEIDHIIPFAMGGHHEVNNLRCLCRNHNLHEAERMLGKRWRHSQRNLRITPKALASYDSAGP